MTGEEERQERPISEWNCPWPIACDYPLPCTCAWRYVDHDEEDDIG